MADASTTQSVFDYLNSIGTVGLAFIVWSLMTGRLITKRENDREIMRNDKLDQRLERAMSYNDRTLAATDKLVEKIPAKN